jgi:hypothetical protein
MWFRLFVLTSLALALAGCVTVSNTLPADQIANMRVAEVRVSFVPAASIRWGDGERAYATSKGASEIEADALAKTPEGQVYIRNAIASKVKSVMEHEVAAGLHGSRPVRVEVSIKEVMIASAIQRVLVGGHHTLTADVTLVDAKTGAVLSAFPGQASTTMAGQGIGGALLDRAFLADPIDRVVDSYASQYRGWLMRG